LALLALIASAWIRLHPLPPVAPNRDIGGMASDLGWLLSIVALLILGHTLRPARPSRVLSRRRLPLLALAGVIGFASLLFAVHVLRTKSALIGGTRYFWLDDDMMISMRFARNFAAGQGLVWNPGGARVEGFTNPLWTLLMVPAHWLLPAARASAFVLAFSGLLWACTLGATWHVGRRLGLVPVHALLAVVLVAAHRWFFYWATAGSEAVLLAPLILLLAARYLKATRRSAPLSWPTGLLLGLLGLVRADAPVISGVFLLLWWRLIPLRRADRLAWLPAILLPMLAAVARVLYYGSWLPNTYYLRMVDVPSRAAMGVSYFVYALLVAGGLIAFAMLHGIAGRRPIGRWLAAIPLAVLAYSAYCGGDELPEVRFLAPAVPLLVVLAVAGAARVIRLATAPRRWDPTLQFAWLVLLLGIGSFACLLLPYQYRHLGEERARIERNNVTLGLMLKAHTRPDARIAHCWAGAAPYFSERPAVDMLGKVDAAIAHRPAAPDDSQTAHNKYDPDYVFGLRPDVVVASFSGQLTLDREAFDTAPERAAYAGLFRVLEHPVFWSDYLPGLVRDPVSVQFHGVFVRQDSRWADPPDQWRSGLHAR
jgi:hypothetical protein